LRTIEGGGAATMDDERTWYMVLWSDG